MTDRTALLESALDWLPDGLALLEASGNVVLWNQAAGQITGYAAGELVGRQLPEALSSLSGEGGDDRAPANGAAVHLRHRLGHEVAAIARSLALRNEIGDLTGTAVLFHPVERLDALAYGEAGDDEDVRESQEEFEDRLREEFEDFERGGQPMGVLWIGIDQGAELRKTHGAAASQAMLGKIRQTLARGLRPAEELGRWGEDEFVVIAHERTAEMLAVRARTLAGQARTADFRWWGDRVSLTVSIGAAQAGGGESLEGLLKKAREAMEASVREGGNRVSCAERAHCHSHEEWGGQA